MKVLLHWYRLLTEPSGHGRLLGAVRRWHVLYLDGSRSQAMGYDIACEYAEMFGGEVVREEKQVHEAQI